MQKSFIKGLKDVFILIALLILPFTNCVGQEETYEEGIIYNTKTSKFELTTEAGIDQSIIASEWIRLESEIKRRDSIITEKDATIKKLSEVALNRLNRINQLTDVVIDQNKKVDSISDKQLDIAINMLSRFKLNVEVKTNLQDTQDIKARLRLMYDLKKVYIFTEGSAGTNNNSNIDIGVGYKIF